MRHTDQSYLPDQPDLPEQPDYIPTEGSVLTLAILGDLIPITIWLFLNWRYGNDLAWQEGAAFYAMVLLLIVLFVAELNAYRLAKRKITHGPMARGAMVIAGVSLLGTIGIILFIIGANCYRM